MSFIVPNKPKLLFGCLSSKNCALNFYFDCYDFFSYFNRNSWSSRHQSLLQKNSLYENLNLLKLSIHTNFSCFLFAVENIQETLLNTFRKIIFLITLSSIMNDIF